MKARERWLAYSDGGGSLAFWQWCAAVDLVRSLEALGLACTEARAQLGWVLD